MVASNSSDVTDLTDVCPLRSSSNESSSDTPMGEFDWDAETQGIILGYFFYGYTVGNLLGGFVSQYLGGRVTLGISVLFASILSLLSPVCARTSTALFVGVRILSGIFQGPLFPSMFTLMAAWIPPKDKASFGSIVFVGEHLGTVISMGLGGVMSGSDFLGGWPSVFYVFGAVGVLWSVAWFILYSRPALKVPWKDIATSVPFLCLIVFAFLDGIGFFTILTEIPTYLNNIQHFDLASNGILSALPYVCVIIVSPLFGAIADKISEKKWLSMKMTRKLATGVGLYSSCVCLVAMCFVDCNATLAIVFLCLAVSVNGAKYSGANVGEQDISPNFAGVLKGITNAVNSIAGFITPLVVGAITTGNQTLSAWRIVFGISAVAYVIGGIIENLYCVRIHKHNSTDYDEVSDKIKQKPLKGLDLDVLEEQKSPYRETVSSGARAAGKLDQDDVVTDGGWGLRHVFGLLSFSALTVSYMNRNNINIAIVAMVASNSSDVTDLTDVCPLRSSSNESSSDTPMGEFDWDETTRGMILGCFFYGYTVGNLLGGFASEYLGGRVTLGVSVLSTSILSLLSPVCVRTSTALYMGLRIVSGIFQDTPKDKASFSSIVLVGNHMGTVISMGLGGVMSSSDFLGGWPSVFYVFGAVGVLWSVAWFILIRDQPEKHPWISSKELSYIRSNSPIVKSSKALKVPWKDIATSMPFWCLIIFAFGDGVGFFTILTEIPSYLNNIQHFDLASNGVLSALPYVCVLITSPLFGAIADKISEKKWLSMKMTRKLATGVGLYSSCVCLIAMCFVDCNAALAIVFLCLAVGLNGAKYSGACVGEQDISPNFAGVLKGMVNSMASIVGIITPLVVGVITTGNQTLSAWRIVFGISAAAYFIGGSAYLMFGTDKVQPWNEPKRK
ncbi:vesicular glutamate transporter 1-like [Macrobrachium rosenbergii]|uniref:vesicular glutamate transporter 1-like n=1 Tax=Macrobrachium rosenbergii TaxID=79674 RepID=UPI0034D5230D